MEKFTAEELEMAAGHAVDQAFVDSELSKVITRLVKLAHDVSGHAPTVPAVPVVSVASSAAAPQAPSADLEEDQDGDYEDEYEDDEYEDEDYQEAGDHSYQEGPTLLAVEYKAKKVEQLTDDQVAAIVADFRAAMKPSLGVKMKPVFIGQPDGKKVVVVWRAKKSNSRLRMAAAVQGEWPGGGFVAGVGKIGVRSAEVPAGLVA